MLSACIHLINRIPGNLLPKCVLFSLLILGGCTTSSPQEMAIVPDPPTPPVLRPSLIEGTTDVTGTAIPKAMVKVFLDRKQVASGITTEKGTFVIEVPPMEADQDVAATQSSAGLESPFSSIVVVEPAVLTQITIGPSSDTTIEQGQARHFSAKGMFSNGRVEEPLVGVSWNTDDAAIARIELSGLATGVAVGRVKIQASRAAIQSTPLTLTVQPAPPRVTSGLLEGDTVVRGNAQSEAKVQLLVNGLLQGALVQADSQGGWQITELAPLRQDDHVTTIQTINGVNSNVSPTARVHPNQPPLLNPIGNQQIQLGNTLNLLLTATDPEDAELTLSVPSLPPNSTLNQATGEFTFTPTAEQAGTTIVTFQVSDGWSVQEEQVSMTTFIAKNIFILLDNPDGSVGQIQITNAQGTQVLDTPNQAVGIHHVGEAPGRSFKVEREKIDEIFERTMEAEPEAPLKFILYFETETTELSEDSRQQFPHILSAIAEREVPDIEIIGHTDRVANETYNARLSLERAKVVRDAIVASGVDPQVIQLSGHGENNLLAKTPDGVSEPLNRRVEVMVR